MLSVKLPFRKGRLFGCCWLISTLPGLRLPAFAQPQKVSVNAAAPLNNVKNRPLGINTDYWWDDAALRPAGSKTLVDALKEMGTGQFLRYPGGEKSDGYLWSTPPFDKPNPRLARISLDWNDWPSYDVAYWLPKGDTTGSFSRPIYDFDAFMTDCRAVGGEAVIVVAYDGIYKPALGGGASLTYQEALETAKGWVRYANKIKGYNVKYWSIGNETWLEGYMGGDPGATQYGKDVAVFARAMKAIDPTIKIGISGNSTARFDATLMHCAADIDFLDVHTYPCFGMTSYDAYANTAITPLFDITQAQQSIDKLPAADKNRLFIAMTESASGTFKEGWNTNDMGSAVANFDIFAQLLTDKRVKFSQFWNTRFVNNNTRTDQMDALNKDNTLSATGLSMAVLSRNLLENMVNTTSTFSVRTFASVDEKTGELNVYLLNKSKAKLETVVDLQNYRAGITGQKWILKGNSEKDTQPTYRQAEAITVSDNQISLLLDPVSVTVLKLSGTLMEAANLIENPGFEADRATTQTPMAWSTVSAGSPDADYTEANFPHSGTYKATHYRETSYEVLTAQTMKALPGGRYTLKAWVTSSGGQTASRLEVTGYGGAKRTIDLPVSNTWQHITLPDIEVTNGQCTVGFYSNAAGKQWSNFDDVEFYKQSSLAVLAVSEPDTTALRLQIMPNPVADGYFTLTVAGITHWADTFMSLHDVAGRMVHQELLRSPVTQHELTLPPGLYILKVSHKTGVLTKKLLIE